MAKKKAPQRSAVSSPDDARGSGFALHLDLTSGVDEARLVAALFDVLDDGPRAAAAQALADALSLHGLARSPLILRRRHAAQATALTVDLGLDDRSAPTRSAVSPAAPQRDRRRRRAPHREGRIEEAAPAPLAGARSGGDEDTLAASVEVVEPARRARQRAARALIWNRDLSAGDLSGGDLSGGARSGIDRSGEELPAAELVAQCRELDVDPWAKALVLHGLRRLIRAEAELKRTSEDAVRFLPDDARRTVGGLLSCALVLQHLDPAAVSASTLALPQDDLLLGALCFGVPSFEAESVSTTAAATAFVLSVVRRFGPRACGAVRKQGLGAFRSDAPLRALLFETPSLSPRRSPAVLVDALLPYVTAHAELVPLLRRAGLVDVWLGQGLDDGGRPAWWVRGVTSATNAEEILSTLNQLGATVHISAGELHRPSAR